jgi:putative nucleotidyltransferase with HDIG domain
LGHVLSLYRAILMRIERLYGACAAYYEGTGQGDAPSQETARWRRYTARLIYAFGFALIASALIVSPGPRHHAIPLFAPGDIADREVVAPFTADIEPRDTPKAERDELAKKVAPVFDYDDTATQIWLQNWEQTFRKIREDLYNEAGGPKGPAFLELLSQKVQEQTGQTLLARDLLYLHQNRFSEVIEHTFSEIAHPLLGRLIAASDLFPSYYSTGIVVRQVNQALNETLVLDVSRIWSLDHAREFLDHLVGALPSGHSEAVRRLVGMIDYLILPNLKFNSVLTQKRIAAALGMRQVQLLSIRRGQVVVRRGDRVSDQQAELLQTLKQLTSPRAMSERFAVLFVTLFVFFLVLFRLEISRRSFHKLNLKDALFFMGITLLSLMAVKFLLPYTRIALKSLDVRYGVEYLIPIATGGIIIHLMMGKEAAYTFAFIISVTLASLLESNLTFALWAFTTTAGAIQSIRGCKQRTDLYRCGAWSGLIGVLLVTSFALSQSFGLQAIDWKSLLVSALLALLSGVLSAVITSASIPILEAIFGYTTSLKLLELSNFNHPLLHSLMMKAPGTYHHSVIVGTLAEIAADRVKANSLLARVSAYYHDIGKMGKPLYFIENQNPNQNPHDHLSPAMSAKILFSHVKNGVRLGRSHNLGAAITHIIEQHHGTTLVSYFFNKAKKSEKPDLDPVNEADFRYPGPKPQTREAAIVMVADACEAATRSIADPTPAKIQNMVRNIINKRFLDSQFDQCDLTLSDLNTIEESFTRTLVSLYHHRIEYPGQRHDLNDQVRPPLTIATPPTPANRKV